MFEIDWDKFKEWNDQHIAASHGGAEPYAGAIGGRITFSFTPTGLGTVTKVTCNICGVEHDLSDCDMW